MGLSEAQSSFIVIQISAYSIPGWRKIPKPFSQISRTDQRLHHGLVQPLAKGRPDRGSQSLFVRLWYCMWTWDQETSGSRHGGDPWRSGHFLYGLFPEVWCLRETDIFTRMNEWMNEWMNQSVSQSVNQSISQSIDQSVSQSVIFFIYFELLVESVFRVHTTELLCLY